jgi:hypothetical protein
VSRIVHAPVAAASRICGITPLKTGGSGRIAMAIIRVDHRACGGRAAPDISALARAAAGGPSVTLIHGYRYHPAHPKSDPHRLVYACQTPPRALNRSGRVASWPSGLGLASGEGVCLAYGWPARRVGLRALLRFGEGAFAEAYAAAGEAGTELVSHLAALAAARTAPVDVFAHSLGARVALVALRRAAEAGRADLIARFGRWILLAPAAFAGEAQAALDACAAIGSAPPEIYAVHAAHNARFDALFEAFAPRAARCGPALGRAGLPGAPGRWADVWLDNPALRGWLALRGVRPPAPVFGPCHWSFYLDPGAMALHRAILSRAPGLAAAELKGVAPWPAPPIAAPAPDAASAPARA